MLGEDEPESETLELEKPAKKAAKDNNEEDKEEDKDDKEEKEKTLEEEIEEELEEPDEDKLELTVPIRRKEVLAKYPNIFKEFPALETSMYRERAYTEILPTIDDAKMAVEKSERLDTYENEILNGSTESILTAVLNSDKDSFNKVIDNYLPTLYKVNEAAYYHTLGNVIKHTIMTMVKDGKDNGIDDLIAAADVVNQYIFGSKQFTPPQKLSTDSAKSKEVNEVEEREQKFVQRQFDTARDSVTTKTENILKATIDKNIDPNESMTNYVKKNATREAYEQLESTIAVDSRFRIVLDKLWEKAFSDDFSTESMDRIKSAYLSKAKTLLPSIIKKNRNEALKGLGKRVRDDDEDTNKRDKRGPLPVGKARSQSTSPQSGKTVKDQARAIPKGTSTLDYLMRD